MSSLLLSLLAYSSPALPEFFIWISVENTTFFLAWVRIKKIWNLQIFWQVPHTTWKFGQKPSRCSKKKKPKKPTTFSVKSSCFLSSLLRHGTRSVNLLLDFCLTRVRIIIIIFFFLTQQGPSIYFTHASLMHGSASSEQTNWPFSLVASFHRFMLTPE